MRFVLGNQNTVLLEASCTGNLRKVQQALDKASASDVDCKGQDSWTPLHYAACNGHLSITEALLQHGANANATEKLGRTPLHLAARNGHTEVLASLISARAVADMTDDEGMTPLALAAAKGNTLAAGELIWGHADVNATVQDGASALHLAASYGHAAVVQLLLQKHADPNAQDSDGYTPLMEAAAQGHLPVAKQLLRAHADTAMVNKEGNSASAVAHAEGHAQMANLLMCQTGRPHTGRNPTPAQPLETPSAPPWTPQPPDQPALPQPTPPQARTLYHQGASPQLARSTSARPSSTAASTGEAVAYPAVYSSSSLPSQQPSAGAVAEALGVLGARLGPFTVTHQPQQERDGHCHHSDSLQAEAVQVEAPRMGYVPAAVSFMMGKLQAALPDMLRTASAPVAGASAQASPAQQHSQHHSQQHSRQHSQQHRQQYSGPYGLVDDEEEGDDDEGDTNAGHAQVPNGATLNDQPAAPQGQADVEEGVRAGQAPPLSHGIPFMHPPHLRQPMCRLFRYHELREMCDGLELGQLFRNSTRTFQGRMFNQDGSSQHVMLQWHFAAADVAQAESGSFVTWLDGMSQLEHPHVLPLVGACAEPPATVAPFMPKGSLDGALRGEAPPGGGPSITMSLHWHLRIRLAAACADALSYLHAQPSQLCLCLHELTASSILLDEDLMPQLSGFSARHVSRFPPPAEADAAVVRGLGLIMLQLLTGREAATSLRQDVRKHLQRAALTDVLDPCSGSWPPQQAQQFASLAVRCTSPRPAEVPSLSDLVVPQLAALAAEAAAAAAEPAASTAPYVAASRRPARSEAEREPCSWFKCPISLDVMEDPVVAADGQTYDKACIQQWFDRGKRTSPYSGALLQDMRLTPNYSIKSAISDWQQKQC